MGNLCRFLIFLIIIVKKKNGIIIKSLHYHPIIIRIDRVINNKISKYEVSIKEQNKLLKDKDLIESEITNLEKFIEDNSNVKNIDTLEDEINKKVEIEDKLKKREKILLKYKDWIAT